jgi:hypothetical protein
MSSWTRATSSSVCAILPARSAMSRTRPCASARRAAVCAACSARRSPTLLTLPHDQALFRFSPPDARLGTACRCFVDEHRLAAGRVQRVPLGVGVLIPGRHLSMSEAACTDFRNSLYTGSDRIGGRDECVAAGSSVLVWSVAGGGAHPTVVEALRTLQAQAQDAGSPPPRAGLMLTHGNWLSLSLGSRASMTWVVPRSPVRSTGQAAARRRLMP